MFALRKPLDVARMNQNNPKNISMMTGSAPEEERTIVLPQQLYLNPT